MTKYSITYDIKMKNNGKVHDVRSLACKIKVLNSCVRGTWKWTIVPKVWTIKLVSYDNSPLQFLITMMTYNVFCVYLHTVFTLTTYLPVVTLVQNLPSVSVATELASELFPSGYMTTLLCTGLCFKPSGTLSITILPHMLKLQRSNTYHWSSKFKVIMSF